MHVSGHSFVSSDECLAVNFTSLILTFAILSVSERPNLLVGSGW